MEAFFYDNDTGVKSLQPEGYDSTQTTGNQQPRAGRWLLTHRVTCSSEAYLWEYNEEYSDWIGTILAFVSRLLSSCA